MTNAEKYGTPEARYGAFREYVSGTKYADPLYCAKDAFEWLDEEAPPDRPLPCPFCGGECGTATGPGGGAYAVACRCGYSTGWRCNEADAVADHNRLAGRRL